MAGRSCFSGFLFIHAWCLCLLLVFKASPTRSQNQSCDSNDLSALRGFLSGLDSGVGGWSVNASSMDCCGFDGVSCSGGRVVGLDLSSKSLRGFVSDSLAGLDRLKILNLSSNSLRGVVPPKLFHLQELQRLDLSSNGFSGPVPVDSELPAVQVFNISHNSFNGSQPILSGSVNLLVFDISYNSFSGSVSSGVCNASRRMQVLCFSDNLFSGVIPAGFGSCTSLLELSFDMNGFYGVLPDDLFDLSSLRQLLLQGNGLSGQLNSRISNLSNLVQLDLSLNNFSGVIPDVFGGISKLEIFSAQSNRFTGHLPGSLSNLSSLRVLSLRNNSLSEGIDLDFKTMKSLISIDLGLNSFTGNLPSDLSYCSGLKTLNLGTNFLVGEIPDSFRNLTSLSYLSLSKNGLNNVSSALGILQNLSNLTYLVVTRNFLGGESMPLEGIKGFKNVEVLAMANCGLSGSVPQWLTKCSKLKVLDLSWNHLQGNVPAWLGDLDFLFYLDLSNNSLTGEIPASLAQLKSLMSGNMTQQEPSTEFFPFFIKRNSSAKGLQYNQVSSFPPSLVLSHNMLTGPILPGFGSLKNLLLLDLSKNNLSGTIPEELSGMSSLESLDLSHNNLTGGIPSSLTKLNFLSSFSVAFNNLVGAIPTGGQFSTFSSADFEGNLDLCGFNFSSCTTEAPSPSVIGDGKNKRAVLGIAFGIGIGASFVLAIIYILVSRAHCIMPEDSVKKVADANGLAESAESSLVLLFQNKDNKGLSINDILNSTNNFNQALIVGCGGFGLVYKATLPDGRKVAIKRLSGDFCQMEREFQAEVEALSRAQHKNLVLLQGYCRIGNDRLLIYSYMENGSLDYWLHEKFETGATLDWSTRLQIAQGAARGLSYLHQSCQPHILHRDIKSSNILLDENFVAHLADFGLARLILPYDTHVTTDVVGTLGYIPPEYGHSSVATFKGDVYSFGVVLLELLTSRRPVDMCKPKCCRDLIAWVLQMKKDKKEIEVFDPCIYDNTHHNQMLQVLEIACMCVNKSPKLRPLTQQLVTWLDNIGLEGQLT
ncbi:hypothetical protein J5N97_023729 [Dioscorea zingiberensis]|uniref:non-specific serine/threonine protein kinase n=1 Tax=Dioscorea zingiberensis TaxID=325984 RepID=A0A9D5H893_9LILI|nr:hypothetical protein J5N97_023729 [Dioscorea zingiberensis]